ncbi:MAG: hypothetical protein IJE89_02270 [Bacilli bacterium]|nr:hypothetical protein [Bacilli bacterium]
MSYNKSSCGIVFDENMKDAKEIIREWFKRGKIKTKRLDLILSKLDFNHSVELFIYNNEHCVDSFYYSVDGKKNSVYNDILLVFPRKICVRTFGQETLYEYVEDSLAEDGFRMVKIKTRRHSYSNGIYRTSEFLSESHLDSNSLLIYNKEFSIRLNMSYSRESKLSRIEATELNNYVELEKYLTGLTLPCSILEVYKKICEISLGDVSEYHSLSLSFSRNVANGEKRETDRIDLGHGKLCELKITTLDGKVINMNQTGNFSYNLTDDSVTFSMKELNDDQISYSVSSNTDNKVDDYVNGLMSYDINNARREISSTKKRVRDIFSNSKR